jgi:hypothetical protein
VKVELDPGEATEIRDGHADEEGHKFPNWQVVRHRCTQGSMIIGENGIENSTSRIGAVAGK